MIHNTTDLPLLPPPTPHPRGSQTKNKQHLPGQDMMTPKHSYRWCGRLLLLLVVLVVVVVVVVAATMIPIRHVVQNKRRL